ncbi:MAG: hypothetical protein PHR81_08605, partial [Bacteroidales bacterium]|nr:hypothetical protein [Bacteroidales bacterium]
TSYEEAENDEAGCEKYAEGCRDEILGDMPEVKRWPEADRSRFYQEMESSDMSAFGDKKDEWVECYLSKLEANYASFLEADQDVAGCEKIAKECNDEVFK